MIHSINEINVREYISLVKKINDGAKKYADFCFDNHIVPDLERNGPKAFILSTFG